MPKLKEPRSQVGKVLDQIIQERNWSIKGLSSMLGVSFSRVSQIRSMRRCAIKMTTAQRIAEVLQDERVIEAARADRKRPMKIKIRLPREF